jgi:glycosyltransferase involved in cell wall biosynthesis
MDKNLKPLVSVQICTYNRADLINQAIQSVLNQTYKNIEVIVMDDASIDKTEEVVKNFNDQRIKYFKNSKNFGIAKNRNLSVEKSNGKYIAILDSDDFWNDNKKLENQIKFLEENPGYAVVGTQTNLVNMNGEKIGEIKSAKTDKKIRSKILLQNQFVNSSTVILRKVIIESGKYNPEYLPNDDYDLFLRIGKNHKFANLPDFSTSYRIGNVSYMSNKKLAAKIHHKIIKRYKNDYPNYWLALLKSYLRIFIYSL